MTDKALIEKFQFTPAKDYENLLKQANAMTMIIRSMEKQRAFQNIKVSDMARELYAQGFEEINAQRDINEKLTNELEKLERLLAAKQSAPVVKLPKPISVFEEDLHRRTMVALTAAGINYEIED
jgi:hypothetical protein